MKLKIFLFIFLIQVNFLNSKVIVIDDIITMSLSSDNEFLAYVSKDKNLKILNLKDFCFLEFDLSSSLTSDFVINSLDWSPKFEKSKSYLAINFYVCDKNKILLLDVNEIYTKKEKACIKICNNEKISTLN